jgi:citrate synthase
MYDMLMLGSGFEPDIIPAAMLAHRIVGIMAHWREYTGMCEICRCLSDLLTDKGAVNRGKLFRPTHLYTGHAEPTLNPVAKI